MSWMGVHLPENLILPNIQLHNQLLMLMRQLIQPKQQEAPPVIRNDPPRLQEPRQVLRRSRRTASSPVLIWLQNLPKSAKWLPSKKNYVEKCYFGYKNGRNLLNGYFRKKIESKLVILDTFLATNFSNGKVKKKNITRTVWFI